MDPHGTWHVAHCGDLPLSRPFLPCCGVEWYRVSGYKSSTLVCSTKGENKRDHSENPSLVTSMMN